MLKGFGNSGGTGQVTITSGTTNGINSPGQTVNLSPEDFFFANSTTLYVADSGDGKQTSASSSLGDGGLQKWSLVGSTWTLDYTLALGLSLVSNNSTAGGCGTGTGACTTGLLGLTGELIDNGTEVELFATNYTLNDLNSTYLYEITDVLGAMTNPGEAFTQLATAPADSNFKGVSFAPSDVADPLTPTPLPTSWTFMLIGLAGFGLVTMRPKATHLSAA
jgi:hypothetical protein